MAYQYNPQPGPPLDPSKYPTVGPNGQRYGTQDGYVYNPVTDKYDPEPEKKPGVGSLVGPIAATAGSIAAAQAAFNPNFWSSVKNGASQLFSMGSPNAPASSAPAAAPAATTAAAPFSLSQAPAAGGDLASAAPFAFAPQGAPSAAGAAPGVPSVVSATATPDVAAVAPTWGANLSNSLGIAGQAYFYGSQGYDAYNKMQSGRESAKGGLKATLLSGGPFTAWAAPLVDFLPISSGKHPDQYKRDAVREYLKEKGLVDEEYNLTNADGTKFNIGLDGGARLPGGPMDGQRHYYDVNLDDPNALALIPIADVLAALAAGNSKKLTSDFSGYFVNGATSSGDAQQNMMKYFQDGGLDHDSAYGMIHEMSLGGGKDGKPLLSKEDSDAYKNSLDAFYHVGAYANGAHPQQSSAPVVATKPQASPQPAPSPSPAPQTNPQQAAAWQGAVNNAAPKPAPKPQPKQASSAFQGRAVGMRK